MIQVKVLKGLSSELSMQREKRQAYETNRAFKAAALYTWIYNETTSGQITLDKNNREKIAAEIGISASSVYNYARYAQELSLLTYNSKKSLIVINSTANLCTKYLIDREFYHINYDPDKTPLEYAIKSLEYTEARERMEKGLQAKVRNNPHVKAAFMLESNRQGYEVNQFDTTSLSWLQKQIFAAGGSETTYDALFIPNPDLNRNLKTIAWRRKMKSHVSACYERKKLAKLGLIKLTERPQIQCNYQLKVSEGLIKGRLQNRQRNFDRSRKRAIWQLPTAIEILPGLISPKPAPNQ